MLLDPPLRKCRCARLSAGLRLRAPQERTATSRAASRFRERGKRLPDIDPTSLAAPADLGHEPVIACHPVDVKAASARGRADDPLAGPTGFDG